MTIEAAIAGSVIRGGGSRRVRSISAFLCNAAVRRLATAAALFAFVLPNCCCSRSRLAMASVSRARAALRAKGAFPALCGTVIAHAGAAEPGKILSVHRDASLIDGLRCPLAQWCERNAGTARFDQRIRIRRHRHDGDFQKFLLGEINPARP